MKGKASSIPNIKLQDEAGKRLVNDVQKKLKEFLGKDYNDESLSQYVVVMLAHKTEQHALASNLEEFLGDTDSKEMAKWVFEQLLMEHAKQQQKKKSEKAAALPPEHDASNKKQAKAAPKQAQSGPPFTEAAPGAAAAMPKSTAGDVGPTAASQHRRAAPNAGSVAAVAAAGETMRGTTQVLRQQSPRRRSAPDRGRQGHRGSSSGRGRRSSPWNRSRSRSSGSFSRTSGSSGSYTSSSYTSSSYSSRSRSRGGGSRGRQQSPSLDRRGHRSRRLEASCYRQHSVDGRRRHRTPLRSRRSPSPDRNSRHPLPPHISRRVTYRENPADLYHGSRPPLRSRRTSPPPYPQRRSLSPLDRGRVPGRQPPSPPRARPRRGPAGGDWSQEGAEWTGGAGEPQPTPRLRSRVITQNGGGVVRGRGQAQYQGGLAMEAEDMREQRDARHAQHAKSSPRQQTQSQARGVLGRLREERGRSDEGAGWGQRGSAGWAHAMEEDGEPPSRQQEGRGQGLVGGASDLDLELSVVEGRRVVMPSIFVDARPTSSRPLEATRKLPAAAPPRAAAAVFAKALQQAAGAGPPEQGRLVLAGAHAAGAAHNNGHAAHSMVGRHRRESQVVASRAGVFARLRPPPAGASLDAELDTHGQLQRHAGQQGEGRQVVLGNAMAPGGGLGHGVQQSDQELLRMRMRRVEMELMQLRAQGEPAGAGGGEGKMHQNTAASAAKNSLALRSVCVMGVHPSATEAVLEAHFRFCGTVARVTLIKDPSTGDSSGVAWVQFATQEAARQALDLSGSTLLQKMITVVPKDSAASKAATARLLKRRRPYQQAPSFVPMPLPVLPLSAPFTAVPKRRRVGGRGKSLVYMRQS